MASQVFKNAYYMLYNSAGTGIDLSGTLESLTLMYEAESLDETAMGADTRKKRGGLKVWGITANHFQNFACVDVTVFGLVGCQTCVEFKACNACSTTSNPWFEGSVFVRSYPPMGGAVGAVLMTQVALEPAGTLRHCSAAAS